MNKKIILRLSRYVGIALAVLAPAVVVAQQRQPPGGNIFVAGSRLVADPLEQLRVALVDVIGRVDRHVVGTIVLATRLQSNTTTGTIASVAFTSRGDGVITLVPGGNSVAAVSTVLRTPIAGVDSIAARSDGGMSLTFMVRNGQTFTVQGSAGGNLRDAQINVYWTPLRDNAGAPTF